MYSKTTSEHFVLQCSQNHLNVTIFNLLLIINGNQCTSHIHKLVVYQCNK